MRFPLGFSILLVLILGFACSNPINAYNYEDSPDESGEEQTIRESSALLESDDTAAQLMKIENVSETSQMPEKRAIGMPQISSRDMSSPPEQLNSQQQQEQHRSETSSKATSDNVIGNNAGEPTQSQQPGQAREAAAAAASADGANIQISAPANEPLSGPINQPPAAAQQQQEHSVSQGESQTRGLGSDLMSAIGITSPSSSSGSPNSEQEDKLKQQAQQQSREAHLPPTPVRQEDLPLIIENNKPSIPNQQQQQASKASEGSIQLGSIGSNLTATARGLDGWTNCVGSHSGKYGICKNDVDCNKNKGRADGSCMGGFGVCCVIALTCNDKSFENNTLFANPDFPEPSWEARLCEVEIKKKHTSILQIMIEFEEFELAPPNHDGECITDVFQVKLASNRPSPYSLLRICGQNTGQHMYLDVSQLDEPILLSVATSGGGFPRRWSVRIVQMDDKNFLLAPPGCLQYYTDTVGHFRSFNLGKSLKNLYYAICFRIDNGYSGIRFTENFFGMNGASCRRRIVGPGGRYNGSHYEAHPHHLVIPPPGYAHPLPKPGKFVHPHSAPPPHHYPPGPSYSAGSGRYKRYAYSEPGARIQTRTLHHEHEHEHDHLHEHQKPHHEHFNGHPEHFKGHPEHFKGQPEHFKEHPEKFHEDKYQQYGPQPQAYPPNGQYQPNYGNQEYGPPVGYHEPIKGDFKSDKFEHDKFDKHHEHSGFSEPVKTLSWTEKASDAFGWSSGNKETKHDQHHQGSYGPSYHHQQQKQGYGSNYGGYQQGNGGYQQGYGGYQQGYGRYQQGYGEYHHKEIDKFGKQYEHLEYKQEKNHHGKEHETKDKTSGSWWPSWGGSKKDDKLDKKDKYHQHHEALFPMMHIPEMPHCEPRFCGQNDVITFPPSGDSIAEMCGNRFNRGRGPKIISGSPLVVYVSNRGHSRGAGFDMNYEQVFYIPRPY